MAQDDDSDEAVGGEPTLDELMRWVLAQPAPAPTVSGLIDLAAVGTVLHTWRNSPVEDIHATAGSPLTDGEMMRTNAATTRLVRESFAAFFATTLDQPVPLTPQPTTNDDGDKGGGADAVQDCVVLDEFDEVDLLVNDLLAPLHVALIRRVLPCGYTVAEALGERYGDLDDHIARNLDFFAHLTEKYGLRAALYHNATAGRSQRWWLTPTWPDTVTALRTVLTDPHHDHWTIGGYPDPAARPDRCAEADQLADILRQGPDRLTAAEAQWCIRDAVIGYALPVHRLLSDTP